MRMGHRAMSATKASGERFVDALLLLCGAALLACPAEAAHKPRHKSAPQKRSQSAVKREAPARQVVRDSQAEARLTEIYQLIGQARSREALARAQALVLDHPNFQLAQLVYGDLLSAQAHPLNTFGDVPDPQAKANARMLAELRAESQLRMRALRERPPMGAVPAQFLRLSPRNKHAIAIDTSRARLYLFENGAQGVKLLADYYISVGKLGTGKAVEGDLRTPLGVYFVTSSLEPTTLKDFYGVGALPINYPNPYDARHGKTGSGIWLHGTPSSQFARPPKATDGCIVLSNPDLQRVIDTVQARTTPVLIAPSLEWVTPQVAEAESRGFAEVLQAWRRAKNAGDVDRLLGFYAPDFSVKGNPLAQWTPRLKAELKRGRGREVLLKDISYLRWTDSADTMVVTFAELFEGARTGIVRRQYWVRLGPQWRIFFEGVVG